MAEETLQLKSPLSPSVSVRFRWVLVALILAASMPLVWFFGFRSAAQTRTPCEEEYDTLVKQAKQELIDGDRSAAVNSLIAARPKLRDCQPPSAKDVAPMWHN